MLETTFHSTAVVRHLAAAILTVALVAGVFGAVAPAAAAQQADTIAVGDEAPDFTLQSTDGDTYRLADLRGDKTLVLIFFRGTW